MKKHLLLSGSLLGCLLFALATPALSQKAQVVDTTAIETSGVIIDAPGAGTGTLQGTVATTIDAAGNVAGIYIDAKNAEHGFVRAANGTVGTFGPLGSGTGTSSIVIPIGFDSTGDLAGIYFDGNSVAHGFVRAASGTIAAFSALGAGTGQEQGTYPDCIDAAGDVSGAYVDSNSMPHGFVRLADGTIVPFDPPGAIGASALAINASGVIAGDFVDANEVAHGFVRAANGVIVTFDAPNAGTARDQGTAAIGIDAAGDISGMYADANNVVHGFVRAAGGTISSFDAPGAGTGAYQGTYPTRMDAAGDVAGMFTDANDVVYGFVRTAAGSVTAFNGPGATISSNVRKSSGSKFRSLASHPVRTGNLLVRSRKMGALFNKPRSFLSRFALLSNASSAILNGAGGQYYGTGSFGINASGEVTGIYTKGDSVAHGFVRSASGSVTTFDAPNAGTSAYQGTGGLSINASGTIAGGYADSNSTLHGFVTAPLQTATSVVLSSDTNPSVFGEPVALTATLSSNGGKVPDGETVNFMNGTTSLGSEASSGGAAILSTTELPVGTDSITAVYGGDTNLAGSTSNAVSQVVGKASTTTALTTTGAGSSLSFTATVSGQFGGVPTGTVAFSSGSTSLGNVPLTSGAASLTTLTAQLGTVTAVYSGDSNFTGSTSNALVATPDFNISVNPTSISVQGGQSGTTTVTLQEEYGFDSNVSFACSGLPTGAACSFSLLTVPTPAGVSYTTLTVSTSATSAAMQRHSIPLLPASALAAVLCCFGFRKRRRWQMLLLLAVSVAGLGLLSGCGATSSVGGSGGSQPVTSTVTVTGTSGSLSHTATFQLTVN